MTAELNAIEPELLSALSPQPFLFYEPIVCPTKNLPRSDPTPGKTYLTPRAKCLNVQKVGPEIRNEVIGTTEGLLEEFPNISLPGQTLGICLSHSGICRHKRMMSESKICAYDSRSVFALASTFSPHHFQAPNFVAT
jgi:hypothetical protein